MEEKRCENNFLEPVLGNLQFSRARFGQLTKNLGYRAALLNMLLLPPGGGTSSNNDDFLRPRGDRAGDEIEGQLKKKKKEEEDEMEKIFHIPLVLCFHDNHFHNIVEVESACGAANVFFDKVAATQKKPREDMGRKKEEERKRGLHGEIRG